MIEDEPRTAYCPHCRQDYLVTWKNPPYCVLHVEADGSHLNPETREPVTG